MRRIVFSIVRLCLCGLAILTVIGCGGGSGQAALPDPLGAATSKNTFILFYTDN